MSNFESNTSELVACQKHLFSLDAGLHYLNNAAYGPLLNAGKAAGIETLEFLSSPHQITGDLHYDKPAELRGLLAELINAADKDSIAIIPGASYGMAVVSRNLHRLPGIEHKKHIVILEDEFPNDTYAFQRTAAELGLVICPVPCPQELDTVADIWNERVLASITEETALVVVPQVHWIKGVRFDVDAFGAKCRSVGALFVVDGTQSVGALPFDVQHTRPDALIVCAYKWMLGPYSIGFGYFGSFFDDGVPVEETWMNRVESNNFAGILVLKDQYRPRAQRYNMGEVTQFLNVAIWSAGVRQLLAWGVDRVAPYVRALTEEPIQALAGLGCRTIPASQRADHIIGLYLPASIDTPRLLAILERRRVKVSLRGTVIRVAVHVYNDAEDMKALVDAVQEAAASDTQYT
jgi:selenocysteine lyase/cysteine desulfurase